MKNLLFSNMKATNKAYNPKEYIKAKKYLQKHKVDTSKLPNNYDVYKNQIRSKLDAEKEKKKSNVVSYMPIVATNSIIATLESKGVNVKPPAISRTTSTISSLMNSKANLEATKKEIQAKQIADAKNTIDQYRAELKRRRKE